MNTQSVNAALLSALKAMLEQGERMNEAFYVSGKRKDLLAAMTGQKDLLRAARAAIAAAESETAVGE